MIVEDGAAGLERVAEQLVEYGAAVGVGARRAGLDVLVIDDGAVSAQRNLPADRRRRAVSDSAFSACSSVLVR